MHGVHNAGEQILVDTAPLWLAPVLAANPDVVTPNLDEAEACLGSSDARVMDAHDMDHTTARMRADQAARALVERGARIALVTAGSAGVAVATADAHAWVPAVPARVVSTVGAGDSLVAGFAHAWQHSGLSTDFTEIVEAVRAGVASAAASCEQVLAGGVDPVRYLELLALTAEPIVASGVAS